MLVVISVWHTHVHWEFDWYILSKELKGMSFFAIKSYKLIYVPLFHMLTDSVTYQLIQPGIFG
jgi:hypothetical protein